MQKPVSSYFSDFLFYENGHKYRNIQHPKMKFTSSTGLKAKFLPKFRREYWIAWAVVKAKFTNRRCDYGGQAKADHFKINGSQVHYTKIWETFNDKCKAVQLDWKNKSTEGLARGSAVHDFLEGLVLRKVTATPKKYGVSIRNANNYWKTERDREDIIFRECEVVVGDVDTETAGMIDRLDYPDIPWTVDVVDYKTDDSLDDGKIYNMLPAPFDHMGDTKLNQYSIQVNIYADIIEACTPYKVRDLVLVSVGEEKWSKHILNRFPVINLQVPN